MVFPALKALLMRRFAPQDDNLLLPHQVAADNGVAKVLAPRY
jgi:hypothetical protein